jgi:glycerol-3-phosphate dehydrogenase subunit B
MEKSTDIVIVGGGLAAYAAAVELKNSGREVTLVTKAPGGTALSSGAWDLADHPTRFQGQPWERARSIRANLAEIIARNPFHPYAVLSRHSPAGEFFDFLLQRAGRAAGELPLALTLVGEGNRLMPTDLGTLKPTALVQASMAEADFSTMEKAKVLVVGISGYPQFNARFIREALLAQQEDQARARLEFAGHWEVAVPELPSRSSLTGVEIAQCLDREASFVPLSTQLVKYLEGKVYSHLLLPPVLGLENTAALIAALRRLTGLKVGETLATPMSVPGWRLQEAIQKYFQKNVGEIQEGQVVGFDGEGRRIKSVRIHDRERRVRIRARSFLLATGKYLGGGIRRQERFQESVFHLPLTYRGAVLDDQTVLRTSRPEAAALQPFLSAGVAINPLAQPLNAEGDVIFDNLFASGGILADFDPAHERCAAGVSIASGTIAARGAMQIS